MKKPNLMAESQESLGCGHYGPRNLGVRHSKPDKKKAPETFFWVSGAF
jgi:hypothetical protein